MQPLLHVAQVRIDACFDSWIPDADATGWCSASFAAPQ
jgi:hypothetical protein